MVWGPEDFRTQLYLRLISEETYRANGNAKLRVLRAFLCVLREPYDFTVKGFTKGRHEEHEANFLLRIQSKTPVVQNCINDHEKCRHSFLNIRAITGQPFLFIFLLLKRMEYDIDAFNHLIKKQPFRLPKPV